MEEGGLWPWRIPLMVKKQVVGHEKVSPEDAEELSKYHWYQSKERYATSTEKHAVQNQMHRLIFVLQGHTLTPNILVDHINGDRLDNRRENLRLVTPAENAKNKSKLASASSKFYGVWYAKDIKSYVSAVSHNKNINRLGSFDNEEDAARARDAFILNLDEADQQGYRLNFPLEKEALKLKKSATKKRTKLPFTNVSLGKHQLYVGCVRRDKKILVRVYNRDPLVCAAAVDECIVKHSLFMPLNFPEKYPDYKPEKPIRTKCVAINDELVKLMIKTGSRIDESTIDKEDYDKIKYFKLYTNRGVYDIPGF